MGKKKVIWPIKSSSSSPIAMAVNISGWGTTRRPSACPVRTYRIRVTGDWESVGKLDDSAAPEKWPLK